MQDRPVCWGCTKPVDNDPVYEAACGHDGCPSVVFHGICLMEWREKVQRAREEGRKRWQQWREHMESYGWRLGD